MREANLTIDDAELDAMGIEALLDLSREAGIRNLEEIACHGTGAVVQVEVRSRYDEASLSALDCVNGFEHVTETDAGHLYVVSFTAPELPESLTEQAEDLLGTCDPELDDESATMSLVGPHEVISETLDGYETAGVSPDLRKLGSYEGQSEPADALTDRQREVIRTAFEMGYYEIPREASTEAVASELGLDDSTVAEHLQRAERNVLRQVLK